jgi:hypothetical protein
MRHRRWRGDASGQLDFGHGTNIMPEAAWAG